MTEPTRLQRYEHTIYLSMMRGIWGGENLNTRKKARKHEQIVQRMAREAAEKGLKTFEMLNNVGVLAQYLVEDYL